MKYNPMPRHINAITPMRRKYHGVTRQMMRLSASEAVPGMVHSNGQCPEAQALARKSRQEAVPPPRPVAGQRIATAIGIPQHRQRAVHHFDPCGCRDDFQAAGTWPGTAM